MAISARRVFGWSCFGAASVFALSFLGVSQADAWGALAVGAADNNTVTASVIGKATEDEARKVALESCTTAKGGADKARSVCAVVSTFQNQCFAFAGAEWVLAANEQVARTEAAAKCHGATCPINSGCDGLTFSFKHDFIHSFLLAMILGGLAFMIYRVVFRHPSCPKCGSELPRFRKPTSIKQFIWGGWTCPRCGCEIDKRGRQIPK